MYAPNILVVDDDPNLLEIIKIRLESANYQVTLRDKSEEAIQAVRERVFDLAILDLRLASGSGIELMEEIHAILPDMPVIILTGHGSIETAVAAMKKGAYSYLTKPFEPPDLLLQIEKALENCRLNSEIRRLKGILNENFDFADIIAKSEKMKKLMEMVSRIAPTESTVCICGESGTGKELVARAIHLNSKRKDKPFIPINCAAIPETLLESELFGHEKGAFTGAVRATKGLFSEAHEGSIFLDEIGDLPLAIQSKLLRVLQERQFYPVGSGKSVEVNVRVIVASQKNLKDQVKQGLFREDLFYRIHVIPMDLPPLRERKEDIPPLAWHFLKKFSRQMGKAVKGLHPEAMQKLMLHDWPGNVRELENTIEYAVAMTHRDIITEDLILQGGDGSSISLMPLKEARSAFERGYIIHLLALCQGNVAQAAKLAGKYRADFYDLMKKHSLSSMDFKRAP